MSTITLQELLAKLPRKRLAAIQREYRRLKKSLKRAQEKPR